MIEQWMPLITLFTHFLTFVASTWGLIYYRLHKQHKKDRASKWKEIFETNIVEIFIIVMFIAIVVPNWASLIVLR